MNMRLDLKSSCFLSKYHLDSKISENKLSKHNFTELKCAKKKNVSKKTNTNFQLYCPRGGKKKIAGHILLHERHDLPH